MVGLRLRRRTLACRAQGLEVVLVGKKQLCRGMVQSRCKPLSVSRVAFPLFPCFTRAIYVYMYAYLMFICVHSAICMEGCKRSAAGGKQGEIQNNRRI